MQAKFIDYGTQLDISLIKDGAVTGTKFTASFYNTVGDLIVLAEGEEFFEYCAAAWPGFQMEVVFFAKSLKHMFNAEYMETAVINNVNLVKLKLKTPVEEISRRALPRITLSAMAKVYITTNTKMEYAFDALTVDISLNAISMYSTFKIPPGETPETYTVGLVLRRSSFMLPLKLLRSEPSAEHEKFINKYIFYIDFSGDTDMKDRLLFALFEYKKRSY